MRIKMIIKIQKVSMVKLFNNLSKLMDKKAIKFIKKLTF
jgi:hypothetical protein